MSACVGDVEILLAEKPYSRSLTSSEQEFRECDSSNDGMRHNALGTPAGFDVGQINEHAA